MNERKVISNSQLPVRLPVLGSLVWYMFLDHVQAPSWAWGAIGTMLGLAWIATCISLYHQKSTKLKELL